MAKTTVKEQALILISDDGEFKYVITNEGSQSWYVQKYMSINELPYNWMNSFSVKCDQKLNSFLGVMGRMNFNPCCDIQNRFQFVSSIEEFTNH